MTLILYCLGFPVADCKIVKLSDHLCLRDTHSMLLGLSANNFYLRVAERKIVRPDVSETHIPCCLDFPVADGRIIRPDPSPRHTFHVAWTFNNFYLRVVDCKMIRPDPPPKHTFHVALTFSKQLLSQNGQTRSTSKTHPMLLGLSTNFYLKVVDCKIVRPDTSSTGIFHAGGTYNKRESKHGPGNSFTVLDSHCALCAELFFYRL